MEETRDRIFDLTPSGHVGLDLVNAIDWRTSDRPKELLTSYADLVRWGLHTGLLSEQEAGALRRGAGRRPAEAEDVLSRAVALREALYRIFSAHRSGSSVRAADLERLNGELHGGLSRMRVARAGGGFAWEWRDAKSALDVMLWKTARAACELLISPELGLVRECAGEGCGWLFLDTSRNGRRRWCDMAVCGNRSKASRHYYRRKEGVRA